MKILNIGTGKGTTVLQLIKNFEKSANIKIPYMFVERRKGDIGVSIANIDKAQEILSWNSKYSLNDMCKSTVKWLNKKKN